MSLLRNYNSDLDSLYPGIHSGALIHDSPVAVLLVVLAAIMMAGGVYFLIN